MNTRIVIGVLSFLTLLHAATLTSAASEAKVRLAVLDLVTGEGLKPDDGQTLAMFIRSAIVQTGKFDVMERQDIKRILEEQNFQQAICNDAQGLAKAGKILAASQIMGGRVARLGNVWVVVLNLLEVNSARLLNSQAISYEGPIENLLGCATAAALKLLGVADSTASGPLALAPRVGSPPPPVQAASGDTVTFEGWIRLRQGFYGKPGSHQLMSSNDLDSKLQAWLNSSVVNLKSLEGKHARLTGTVSWKLGWNEPLVTVMRAVETPGDNTVTVEGWIRLRQGFYGKPGSHELMSGYDRGAALQAWLKSSAVDLKMLEGKRVRITGTISRKSGWNQPLITVMSAEPLP